MSLAQQLRQPAMLLRAMLSAIAMVLIVSVSPATPAWAGSGKANCDIRQANGDFYFCYNDHVTVKPKQSLYLKANKDVYVIVYGKGHPSNQLSAKIRINTRKLVYTNKGSVNKNVEFEVASYAASGPVSVAWCTITGNQPCPL